VCSAAAFAEAGAGFDLAGSYNLDSDALDFHGALKLHAKVSQILSGWKRWALKPVDPFFPKKEPEHLAPLDRCEGFENRVADKSFRSMLSSAQRQAAVTPLLRERKPV